MAKQTLLEKVKKVTIQRIGNAPVVVLPLHVWGEIENFLEDIEIGQASVLKKKIARARLEKKLYGASQVKKMLGV